MSQSLAGWLISAQCNTRDNALDLSMLKHNITSNCKCAITGDSVATVQFKGQWVNSKVSYLPLYVLTIRTLLHSQFSLMHPIVDRQMEGERKVIFPVF